MSAQCKEPRANCQWPIANGQLPTCPPGRMAHCQVPSANRPHFHSRFRGERGQALVEYAIVFPIQLMMTLAIIQLAQIFVAKQVVEYAAFCGARANLVGLPETDVQRAAFIPLSGICAGDTVKDSANGLQLPGWGGRYMSPAVYQELMTTRGTPVYSWLNPQPDQLSTTELSQNQDWAQLSAQYRRQLTTEYTGQQQSTFLSGYGTASDPTITKVNIQPQTSPALPGVCCTITHYYQLRVPVGNVIAGKIGQLFLADTNDPNVQSSMTTVNNQWYLRMTASCLLPSPP